MYEPKLDYKLTSIFIINIISIIIILFFPFGGFYDYYYYAGYREWIYLKLFTSFETFILIAAIVICFGYTSYKAFLLREGQLDKNGIKNTMYISILTIVIIVISAIIVAIVGGSHDEYWLSTGFYGSLIGAIISLILFKLVYDSITNEGIVSTVESRKGSQSQNTAKNTKFCPNCGSKITGTNFCQDCGTKL